jgi:NADPH-dependent 2,4-dienoyl-CoA reductase/sulfur reductase-like enzyme
MQVAIIGGGPAGLRAAEIAAAGGAEVTLYEGKASVGRKFLDVCRLDRPGLSEGVESRALAAALGAPLARERRAIGYESSVARAAP